MMHRFFLHYLCLCLCVHDIMIYTFLFYIINLGTVFLSFLLGAIIEELSTTLGDIEDTFYQNSNYTFVPLPGQEENNICGKFIKLLSSLFLRFLFLHLQSKAVSNVLDLNEDLLFVNNLTCYFLAPFE